MYVHPPTPASQLCSNSGNTHAQQAKAMVNQAQLIVSEVSATALPRGGARAKMTSSLPPRLGPHRGGSPISDCYLSPVTKQSIHQRHPASSRLRAPPKLGHNSQQLPRYLLASPQPPRAAMTNILTNQLPNTVHACTARQPNNWHTRQQQQIRRHKQTNEDEVEQPDNIDRSDQLSHVD